MRFYSKLVRINGESVIAVEQYDGRTIQKHRITKYNLLKHWKY